MIYHHGDTIFLYRYPYSIVGIDLTSLMWNMLERRALHPHLYQLATPISLQNFMNLFCELNNKIQLLSVPIIGEAMKDFDGFWQQEKPENLLAYPSVREKFVKHISTKWKANN